MGLSRDIECGEETFLRLGGRGGGGGGGGGGGEEDSRYVTVCRVVLQGF
jgi:hypothetical protein